MKFLFRLAISFIFLAFSTSFSGVAIAQSTYFVTGKSPSGEPVNVYIDKLPSPKYPRRAERLGVQGYVVIAFDVNEQGDMVDLRVTESKPSLVFDKAATQAIKKVKFELPKLDGEVVYASDIVMKMPFRIE